VLLQCRTGFAEGEIGGFGHVGMPYQRHVGLCWVMARVAACLVSGNVGFRDIEVLAAERS